MLKANITPFDQSNIAGLGSASDHEQRIKAAKTENEWKGAGSHVGIEKWHVHDFGVHRVNEQKSFNTFFDGDSYIILHTYKKDDKSNALKYDLYFWLGAHTSQDEAGTGAYKTVELDDLLGEIPVQHREICGHESPEFLTLFGGRIKVLDGGVASAFNHVKPEEYKPRLLHLKGKKHVRATQVSLETKSLNQGDVFLLDAGLTVWIWKGTNAGVFEKREADILAEQIQEERMGKPKVIHLDHNDDDAGFWGLLAGGHNASLIQPAGSADEDEKVSQAEASRNTKSLMVLTDESGQLSVKEVATGKGNIKRSLLKSEDVYFLELGALGVYVWVGKNASKNEQKNAISYAVVSLKQRGKDTNIPIRRVIEGGESEQFISSFDA